MSKHDRQELEFEATVSRDDTIAYLEELVRSLRAGSLYVEYNGKGLRMHPADMIDIEVQGATRADKERLNLKFTWRRALISKAGNGGLHISKDIPEAEEEPQDVATGTRTDD
ncbi:MAG: amphi-Trp domain-containing protein [Planctomycetota bacterium]